MSQKYPGGIISKTAPTPSGPYSNDTAPGVWTLEQQAYWQKLGQWPTAGNVNPSAFIENLFSTYLYTGTGVALNINNGIDLSTKGGLVWIKQRSGTGANGLIDTARGRASILYSNTTGTATTDSSSTEDLTSFNSNGFSLGSQFNFVCNSSGQTFTSWTFREQAKFFDVVTLNYTSGAAVFNHSLGSVPGFVIVKVFDGYADNWWVYHRSLGNNQYISLNLTSQAQTSTGIFSATDTTFTVKNGIFSASTIIAYLFAHDAGGFGTSGSENVISCGSYTGNGSATGPTVTLGYEPQWVLVKRTDSTSNWTLSDNMRGQPVDGATAILYPNASDAEASATTAVSPTATGFQVNTSGATYNASGGTYIYVAIRRGPMAVPTLGTSVFSPIVATNSQGTENTTGFPLDMQIANIRSGYASNGVVPSRLTGVSSNTTSSGSYLRTPSTNAEATGSDITQYWGNTGFQTSSNWAGSGMVYWNFRRAPSFFDEVCDSTGGPTIYHNLGVAPQLIIAKVRNYSPQDWFVDVPALGSTRTLNLNLTGAASSTNYISSPTSTQFTTSLGGGGYDYVYYLFATCAGVSKVGTYTGTGTAQTINCGFTGGSRFVLIKRTDSTGDWFVWDSARGIIPSNDPYLRLNSTAAEVTGTDYVDTTSVGFDITSTAPAAINANGGTFIFLAIA